MDSTQIILAFTHFLYYAEHDFIERTWEGNTIMIRHLKEKLEGFISRENCGYMSVTSLIKFHQELTLENQRKLHDHIMKYHINRW